MKLLLYADPHFSEYGSIVRSRGEKYSTRIENCLASLKWVNDTAVSNGCCSIVCLGDFFDKPVLSAEEITALSTISFDLDTVYIVGNHESNMSKLQYASTNVFKSSHIVNTPESFVVGDTELCFLPYCMEENRKSLHDTFGDRKVKNRVIMSHNDLQIQYGAFMSKNGYSIDDVNENCDLFFNGHLHNACDSGKIINVGNLTGLNFSEDATEYIHRVIILDTDTLDFKSIENPYAFNFYHCGDDLCDMKSNAVVSAIVSRDNVDSTRKALDGMSNVITYKVVAKAENVKSENVDTEKISLAISYLDKFREYVNLTYENTDTVKCELNEICRE